MNFLDLLSIQMAIPKYWLRLTKLTGDARETMATQIQKKPDRGKSKWYYWELMNQKTRCDAPFRNKWEIILQKEVSDNEWQNLIINTNKITISTKLRAFQYRLINFGLPTNVTLQKWNMLTNANCTFCKIEDQEETYLHLFCKCSIVRQKRWVPLTRWLDYFCFAEVDIEDPYAMLFNRFKGCFANMINTILLIAKYYIYVKRCLKEDLRFIELTTMITQYKNIEAYIAKKNQKSKNHNQKWLMYDKI